MNNTSKDKRLDRIEVQLTPRQWAIRLADEMRRYPSIAEFMKAAGKGDYSQLPFVRPVYALAAQAEERWKQDSRRKIEGSRKLRMEFQALKKLILNVNVNVGIKMLANGLRVALQVSDLRALALEGALAQIGVTEKLLASSTNVALQHHDSRLGIWADATAELLIETTAHKAAVQAIQEKYFEGHSILLKNVEREIETTVGKIRDVIAGFNEYFEAIVDVSGGVSAQEQQKAEKGISMPFERENSVPNDIEAVKKRREMVINSLVERG